MRPSPQPATPRLHGAPRARSAVHSSRTQRVPNTHSLGASEQRSPAISAGTHLPQRAPGSKRQVRPSWQSRVLLQAPFSAGLPLRGGEAGGGRAEETAQAPRLGRTAPPGPEGPPGGGGG